MEKLVSMAEFLTYKVALASVNPPSVWNYYPTMEAAAAHATDANEYNVKLEAHGAPKRHYVPMLETEYRKAEREFYLQPEVEIPREKYWEMLEVLPPMAWRQSFRFESFNMSEHETGPYTRQYARRGDEGDGARYFMKMVDVTDKTTWMQP